MVNKIKKAFCISLASALVLIGANAVNTGAETSGTDSGNLFSSSDGYIHTLSRGGYEFCLNSSNGEFFVKTPKGSIWYSNPQGSNTDELAEEQERGRIHSQLVLKYFFDQKPEYMNSYNDSVQNQPPEIKTEDNLISVKYTFGKEVYSNDMLPTVISKKRMENDILPKLSDEEKSLILSRYSLYEKGKMDKGLYETVAINFPVLAKHDIYARGEFPDYVGEEIYAALTRIGYGLSDLERDCEENGIDNTYTPPILFSVTVDYSLNERGLCVTVDPQKITYNTVKPVSVELLPFFGCAGREDMGYMLVPDGSGAIINFNNGKTNSDSYQKPLFGYDNTLTRLETGSNEQISALPVFALSKADKGYMAVISSGYECATVNAFVSGKNNIFNNTFASFDTASSDFITVTSSSDGQLLITSDDMFSDKLCVEYVFTEGYTDYSKFAALYREYLKEAGVLSTKEDNTGVLNVEFTGTVSVKKKIFGFSYSTLEALTTFNEAEKILNELGTDNLQVRLTNSVNGGMAQKYGDRIKFAGVMGSKKAYRSLNEKAGGVSIGMDIQNVSKASKSKTVKMLNQSIAKQYKFDPISKYMLSDGYGVLISPSLWQKNGEKLIKSANKNNVKSLLIEDITYNLNSDFEKNRKSDRAETRKAAQKLMSDIVESNIKLESDNAGIYSLPYISQLWDIPTQNSGFYIEDASVPFYAMVVRGSIPYCTTAVNSSSDSKKAFLNAVEIGAGLQFSWINSTAENVISDSEKYYDRIYDRSIDTAKDYYNQYNELYSKLHSAEIISHNKLSNGVVCTVYGNGITVYINYSEIPLNADGVNVPAMGFAFKQKGAIE